MSAEAPFLSPIDIQAASLALIDPTGQFPGADTQGRLDERLMYRPFAELYLGDRRMRDIGDGLGRLGLIAVQESDIHGACDADRRAYVDALLRYDGQLASRARTLPLPGALDRSDLRQWYPEVDERWVKAYVPVLHGLREVMRGTQLFKYAQRQAVIDGRIKTMQERTVPTHDISIGVNQRNGRLRIDRRPKYAPIRQEAA